LNLDTHFYKTYKAAAEKVNFYDTAERIYKSMIMPSSLAAAKLRLVGHRHVGAK